MKKILQRLKDEVPEFYKYEEFDNLLYVDFDRLGTFINNLLDEIIEDEKYNDKKNIIKKIFDFLNNIFDNENKEILDLIYVCIFESLIGNRYAYDVAKKYMSEEMYNYFTDEFPYSKYKDSWNTSKYYSEEEYQRILNFDNNDTN